MATDLYAKCPCGSGKKIKFCCRDIISDIERIERMLKGEQRNAALEKINKLLEKHADRPALLSLKAQLLLELEQPADAREVIDRLLQVEPDNPSGSALDAIMQTSQGDLTNGLASLHRAMRVADGVISSNLYNAYMAACVHMIQQHATIAAYAHLMTIVAIARGQDKSAVSMLMRLSGSDAVPAIFQGLMLQDQCPEATWKREFEGAMDYFRKGDWSEAAELLEGMTARILDEPVLLRNVALLQAWTGQDEKAIKSFRSYAKIRGIDPAEAIEAEACAQVLVESEDEDLIDVIRIEQDITDADAMMEMLLSHPHVESTPVNPDGDSPPPKGQFVLADRPLLKPDGDRETEVTLEEVPREFASVSVYGRETDRNPRVQLMLIQDENYDTSLEKSEEILGIKFGPDVDRESLGQLHVMDRLLRPNLRPAAMSADQYRAIEQQWQREQLMQGWPNVRFSLFGGMSALEAAKEPKNHRAILAAIVNLELWCDRRLIGFDATALRSKLGLPSPEPVKVDEANVAMLSPYLLRAVDLKETSDDALQHMFEVVSVRSVGTLLRKICQEVLTRPSMADKIDPIELHQYLATTAASTDEHLEHLGQAREIAVSKGASPASFLVDELDVRLLRAEVDAARRLVAEIQARYLNEPGVSQKLSAVLQKYGVLPTPGASTPRGATTSREPVPAAASESQEGIWTPDSPQSEPSDPAGGEKSKLWVPGMD